MSTGNDTMTCEDPFAFVDALGGRTNLFGPGYLATIIEAIQTGIILAQYCHFLLNSEREHVYIKLLVTWAVGVGLYVPRATVRSFATVIRSDEAHLDSSQRRRSIRGGTATLSTWEYL